LIERATVRMCSGWGKGVRMRGCGRGLREQEEEERRRSSRSQYAVQRKNKIIRSALATATTSLSTD